MKISRYNQKSSHKCSCCSNKSNKPFEILIIESGMGEQIFYLCSNCQKEKNLTTKNFNFNVLNNKFYIN